MTNITEKHVRKLVRKLLREAGLQPGVQIQKGDGSASKVAPISKVIPEPIVKPVVKSKTTPVNTAIPAGQSLLLKRYQKQIKLIKDGFRESELQASLQLLVKSLRDFNRNITQSSEDPTNVNFKSSLVLAASQDLTNKLNFISKEFFKLTKMTDNKD